MKRKKIRKCKLCGSALEHYNIMLCDACQSAGFTLPRKTSMNENELLELVQEREQCGVELLLGLNLDEIVAVARAWNAKGYTTYGKFCAWCNTTGKLPPKT